MILEQYPNFILALTLWRESRGCSQDERRGVLHVILNRAAQSPKFKWSPRVEEVCLQPWQFSCFNAGDANVTKFPMRSSNEWKAFEDIARLIEAPGEDPTGGANHYHSLPDGSPFPQWARREKKTCSIGVFKFYRL